MLLALHIRERVCGAEHPHTAFSLNSLSVLYTELGRVEEAKKCSHRAADIFSKVVLLFELFENDC